MIKGKVLNSEALLNNFIEIGALEFIAGSELKLVIRLYDDQLNLRYIPVDTCVTKITFLKSDNTTFEKTGIPEEDDRSIIRFSLSEVETTGLMGGNLRLSLDLLGDGTSIVRGIIANALARTIIDCE